MSAAKNREQLEPTQVVVLYLMAASSVSSFYCLSDSTPPAAAVTVFANYVCGFPWQMSPVHAQKVSSPDRA
jgi:hypothetical protein